MTGNPMKKNTPLDPESPVVTLDNQDAVQQILSTTVLSLWEIVNNLTRIRPKHRLRYRVTIFGSARILPESPAYGEVRQLAAALAEMGCDIITGGGPGLMQAANEGAAQSDPNKSVDSIGIRIDLPFEQGVNPFVEKVFLHRTFFTRLHHFVLESDAFVVVSGGIGTLLEMAMIWQLLQVRHLYEVPLLLIGPMWQDFLQWARTHMLQETPSLASPQDLEIPTICPNAECAIQFLREHHAQWQKVAPPA